MKLAFIILLVIVGLFYITLPDCVQHESVCFGDVTVAPVRYRVLQLVLNYGIVPDGNHQAVITVDFLTEALLTVAFFVGLWRWLGQNQHALIGCALTACLMLVSFHYWFLSVGVLAEMAFVVWGLLCLSRMRRSSLPPV